jgi:superfamily II DNA or RNA helicase
MSLLRASTLILVTNVTAARQWKQELLDKTTIPADAIGLYNGDSKEIRPVTVGTYQILTHPVAIQVSGMFGSRQEEAQRLGRILRPKAGENQAHFYSIISRDTVEQEFALNRQHFLCEQGYQYRIVTLDGSNAPLPEAAVSPPPFRDEPILCPAG